MPRKKSARSAGGGEEPLSGRYALANGPLGIVLAGLIVIETIMGLVVRSEHPPANASFIIYAMVVLAFATLFGFFIVWIRFPRYLYPPSTKVEPKLVQLVDLKFFYGFSLAEIAALRNLSERTVQRSWERARINLHRSIRADLPL